MDRNIVIIESKAYYEAYSHVLKHMQTIKSIPFEDMIVKGNPKSNQIPNLWRNNPKLRDSIGSFVKRSDFDES